MKLTHKLCGAALVAAAGVALVLPNTTKADTMNGKGHIGFTEDTSGIQTMTDNSTTKDSSGDTGTGTDITSNDTLTINTSVGEFGIISVSPLEFKTHEVLSAAQETFNADLYENNGVKMANFVTYTDKRAADRRAGYKLSAKITDQFKTTAGDVLNGATITYNNVWVNDYTNAVQPSTINNNVTVGLNQPGELISNLKGSTNAGYGQHDVKFGETAGAANADKSVTLTIPKAQNASVVAGDYNGIVEWTLLEAN